MRDTVKKHREAFSNFPCIFANFIIGILYAKTNDGVKTKTIILIVTAGFLGALTDVNAGDTTVAPAVAVAAAPQAPTALTASTTSSAGAPLPPTGLTVCAAPAPTLAAIPSNCPGGYYTNGDVRGYYINVNSPYWATNQTYGDISYCRTNNLFTTDVPKVGTNQ
ncbi:MAG TPA: hypothetical protein VNU95_06145 [Candidatus Acidoferrales bacterium]|jgi:hypothetical protein|nr:hypothetical protein [Candidatus Acidoferrales bacterium]